jgi:hypothetical protein
VERSSGSASSSLELIELKLAQMYNAEFMMLNVDDTFRSPTEQSNGQSLKTSIIRALRSIVHISCLRCITLKPSATSFCAKPTPGASQKKVDKRGQF